MQALATVMVDGGNYAIIRSCQDVPLGGSLTTDDLTLDREAAFFILAHVGDRQSPEPDSFRYR